MSLSLSSSLWINKLHQCSNTETVLLWRESLIKHIYIYNTMTTKSFNSPSEIKLSLYSVSPLKPLKPVCSSTLTSAVWLNHIIYLMWCTFTKFTQYIRYVVKFLWCIFRLWLCISQCVCRTWIQSINLINKHHQNSSFLSRSDKNLKKFYSRCKKSKRTVTEVSCVVTDCLNFKDPPHMF